jgi:DNA modification methylase
MSETASWERLPAIDAPIHRAQAPSTPLPRSTPDCHEGSTPDGRFWRIISADAQCGIRTLPAKSIACIITSPPYYWQRGYEIDGQIGHEPTITGYVTTLTDVFREARRVLADDGVLFLNIGDTYYSAKGRPHGRDKKHNGRQMARRLLRAVDGPGLGLPRKSLIGIPWRVALAMQEDGWTLRSAVIWHRPGTLPEPTAVDRPWRTTEHVFIFSKKPRYWFNRSELENQEDIWIIKARPDNPHSHFAPFPSELVERCLACGCKPGGIVLDPFVGSGTTLLTALRRGHSAIGIDLKAEYCSYVRDRIRSELPLTRPATE